MNIHMLNNQLIEQLTTQLTHFGKSCHAQEILSKIRNEKNKQISHELVIDGRKNCRLD